MELHESMWDGTWSWTSLLDDPGADGWELVSIITPPDHSRAPQAIFKRPA